MVVLLACVVVGFSTGDSFRVEGSGIYGSSKGDVIATTVDRRVYVYTLDGELLRTFELSRDRRFMGFDSESRAQAVSGWGIDEEGKPDWYTSYVPGYVLILGDISIHFYRNKALVFWGQAVGVTGNFGMASAIDPWNKRVISRWYRGIRVVQLVRKGRDDFEVIVSEPTELVSRSGNRIAVADGCYSIAALADGSVITVVELSAFDPIEKQAAIVLRNQMEDEYHEDALVEYGIGRVDVDTGLTHLIAVVHDIGDPHTFSYRSLAPIRNGTGFAFRLGPMVHLFNHVASSERLDFGATLTGPPSARLRGTNQET